MPCRALLTRQNEYGRQRSPTLPSRITTFAPSLHGGAFLLWLSRAPAWRATWMILPDAERWRRMSTRSAVLNSRCSRNGVFVAPAGLCAAARQLSRNGCSHPSARCFSPRTLRGRGHENSFQCGLHNGAHIRARQHRCYECSARDCPAGFNEQLI